MKEIGNDIDTESRIKLLQKFYEILDEYYTEKESYEKKKVLRSKLNRNLVAVKNAVTEAGTHKYNFETINGFNSLNTMLSRD